MILVYITTKDRAEANRIGKVLVEKRHAACVNILDGMQSIYWWEGKIEEASETVLLAKTVQENIPGLIQEVKKLHSYSVPCVVTLPISDGNPDFLKWIKDETRR